MAQKQRSISPDDAQDERLAALPLAAAHTYAYLPTVLDDEGRAKDQPAVLNGYLWPLRADEHPTEALEADLAALAGAGLICRYSVGGRSYLHDPRWKLRHKASRPVPSTLEACPVHERSFDDALTETLSRFADQVNAVVGAAASHIDQKRIQDSFARIVEDVTYLVDPEKAVVNGQKVRNLFVKGRAAAADGAPVGDGDPGAEAGPSLGAQ
jgi:hypothetical protein